MRIIVITKEDYGGFQRKLAWFDRRPNGLYFDTGGLMFGTHTSYHRDGNVFRTSPATENKPKFEAKNVELDNFRGWHQFGVAMIAKDNVQNKPCLKGRDRKKAGQIIEISTENFPSKTINMVTEIVSPDFEQYLQLPQVAPPLKAITEVLKFAGFSVVLTILGHDANLLVRPTENGFAVSHFNSRFSTNQEGVTYSYEAWSSPFGTVPNKVQ